MSDKPKPKPPLKDRILDRIPLFGTVRRTKGWIRRHKGLVYLILGVVVIFIVRPVLSIIAVIFQTAKPFIDVLINNPVGRFIFYNVMAILLLWIVWRQVRAGVRRVFGMFAMRRFLDGVNLMLLRRWDAAIPHFEKVLRIGRTFRLEDAVPEHRDILADARLKIAYCHLKRGRSNDALRWLKVVKVKDILTDHVRRNHTELHALAYDLNNELEQETILKELEKGEGRDRRNRRILLALRTRHEEAGDLAGARDVARRLVARTEGRERDEAERDLALLEFRVAHQALAEGDRRSMMKALNATAGDTRSALKLGDLALEDGNVTGALKAWSRAVSLPVFERIATLLADGRLAGDKEKDLLLKHFPYAGTLLVLAEHYHRKGEFRKARAALDRVLETAGENLLVLRLYAACLEGEGHTAEAAQLYRRALSQSLG
jgi:tetratricopeptide (TPR) repeat protein